MIAGRLTVNFVNIQGIVDSGRPDNITFLDGTPVSPTSAISPDMKVKIIKGTNLPNITYVYITHDICEKISNDYLYG